MLREPNYTVTELKYLANRDLPTKEGYQWYNIDFQTGMLLPIAHSKLDRKRGFIEPVIKRKVVGKRVLDLGCDKGYFSWYAMNCGATHVVANEVNPLVYQYLTCLTKTLRWEKVEPVSDDLIATSTSQFDIVVALAVVHEIMLYRKKLPVANAVRRIRELSIEGAIVEFCEDYQSQFGLTWCRSNFERLLAQEFCSFEVIGDYQEHGGRRYTYDCCC